MSKLFSPLTIKTITLKNRLVVSPMCQYSSEHGFANNWHLVHLVSRAVGGAGLVFTEATAVSPEGRISPSDLGLWNDEQIDKLKEITTEIEKHGSIAGIQLAHAGRKSSQLPPWEGSKSISIADGGWSTFAPSAIAYKAGEPVPTELNTTQIHQLIQNFKVAAGRAVKAGFKVIEIHAAHGYLIHEFLSPLSNHRADNYGGSFENRIRFLKEIVTAVRSAWPSGLPIFVRISASEYAENGWSIQDSHRLSAVLKESGVDLIDCSSGGNIHGPKIEVKPMYQTHFAEQIKKFTGAMTGAVGLITTAKEAESIVAEEKADLVFMARELLRDPYFPLHAAKQLGVEVSWPVQYERAKK